MKTIGTDLTNHIAGEVTTLAFCWKIIRTDGVSFFFTDSDEDIPFGGDTYVSMNSFNPTAIANDASFSVDNMSVAGVLDDDSITEEDMRAGLFNYAEVYMFAVNWAAPTQGKIRMRRGWFGEVVLTLEGYYKVELRGLTQAIQQRVGELYSNICRADLGDSRCKIPLNPDLRQNTHEYRVGDFIKIATGMGIGYAAYENRIYKCTTAGASDASAPTYDIVVGHTTTDGTAVFTAVEAWSRDFTVMAVTDRQHFTIAVTESRDVDGWFSRGVMTFENGDNEGVSFEVKSWVQSGSHIVLQLATNFDVQAGDIGRLYPGCDLLLPTCRDKFGNVDNMRAEPYIPGSDQVLIYPDASGNVP